MIIGAHPKRAILSFPQWRRFNSLFPLPCPALDHSSASPFGLNFISRRSAQKPIFFFLSFQIPLISLGSHSFFQRFPKSSSVSILGVRFPPLRLHSAVFPRFLKIPFIEDKASESKSSIVFAYFAFPRDGSLWRFPSSGAAEPDTH